MSEKKASIRFIEMCYKLYEQNMYYVAYRILQDVGLAEDAVQEAFVKLMKSGKRFENVESDDCKRYIITVIKHASIDIYNKKRKEQEVMYLSDHEIMEETISNDSPESQYDIKDMIDTLPEKYYQVVDCLVVKELSVKETAVELKITESNVRKRFERAKILLKGIVKGGTQYETKRIYG